LQIGKKLKAAVGQLTRLQDLRLCQHEDGYANSYYHDGSQLNLPNSLTHLELQLPHSFCRTYTPSAASLTSLQHLQLKHITALDSTMMTHMTRLKRFELRMRRISRDDLLGFLTALPGCSGHTICSSRLALPVVLGRSTTMRQLLGGSSAGRSRHPASSPACSSAV
jgi:hypothetical protein